MGILKGVKLWKIIIHAVYAANRSMDPDSFLIRLLKTCLAARIAINRLRKRSAQPNLDPMRAKKWNLRERWSGWRSRRRNDLLCERSIFFCSKRKHRIGSLGGPQNPTCKRAVRLGSSFTLYALCRLFVGAVPLHSLFYSPVNKTVYGLA